MIQDVLQLMLKSDMHRDWYVSDLERLVLPAIEAKKMTVVYENKITSKTAIYPRPTGLFTHAFLTEEAADGYEDGTRKLQPEDWFTPHTDGKLYVIDFIAPYNNALKIGRFVQQELTSRYIEVYPYDGAAFLRQMNGKKKGYATGVQEEIVGRRHSCV
jgi:hemolysin-activating ACP:hemolysin acyltransferase